jgi:hypothetical protein
VWCREVWASLFPIILVGKMFVKMTSTHLNVPPQSPSTRKSRLASAAVAMYANDTADILTIATQYIMLNEDDSLCDYTVTNMLYVFQTTLFFRGVLKSRFS